jgi:hypothetical protein
MAIRVVANDNRNDSDEDVVEMDKSYHRHYGRYDDFSFKDYVIFGLMVIIVIMAMLLSKNGGGGCW